ncbi:MAG TPA: hypothetical protein VIY72_16875 [Acidimicrobiales bacterium]
MAVVSIASTAGAQTDGNVNGEQDTTSSSSSARPPIDDATSLPVAQIVVAMLAAGAMATFAVRQRSRARGLR